MSCTRPLINFYPRPPRGGRPVQVRKGISFVQFLSTPSARRATGPAGQPPCRSAHFYPRPPRGGRPKLYVMHETAHQFLSTPSARRATRTGAQGYQLCAISIHALREEGDFLTTTSKCPTPNFYPRPPRGGRHALSQANMGAQQFLSTPSARRATGWWYQMPDSIKFLSTPSARRATCPDSSPPTSRRDFYPRPPRGGRPFLLTYCATYAYISIHALREEGDTSQTVPSAQ